jgi:TonB-dependent receptor
LFSNFKDYGQKYAYKLNGSNAKFSTSIRRPDEQIAMLALGGNQVFAHSFLTYQVAVARSRFGGAAGNPGADFAPVSGSNLDNLSTCSYDASATVSKYRPQFTGCTTLGSSIYDPTQYALQDINTTTGQATQLNLQAGAALGFNYHLGSHASTFELGGQFRNEHKGQAAYSPTYDNGATPLMTQFLSSFTNPKFYGGSYQLGPVTNFDSIVGYLNSNPGALPLDTAATALSSDASNYNLQERVTSGYIMNTIDLGTRFHLQTGLRIEATNTSDTGYLVVNDADGNYVSTSPQHASGSYINPLPSVQLRYKIDNESGIRAVYGRGISRPDPYQLVPYVTLDQSTTPYTVGIGNPGIVAEHANDYDVLYERYLPSIGMIQAGYFYKALTKPIFSEQVIVPASDFSFAQLAGQDTVLKLQEVNGDHAHVQGIELAYQQHLNYLPGVLAGAQINANFTYTASKNYNVTGRSDNPQLVGQAPYSWNITPAYATRRALVTVGITHNSANIYAYQYQSEGPGAVDYGVKGPNGDNYFYSHTQIDAQASYYIGKGFTILGSGLNMNNEVFGFYNGSPQYMVQREYYKPTYSGGIKWSPHREP